MSQIPVQKLEEPAEPDDAVCGRKMYYNMEDTHTGKRYSGRIKQQ